MSKRIPATFLAIILMGSGLSLSADRLCRYETDFWGMCAAVTSKTVSSNSTEIEDFAYDIDNPEKHANIEKEDDILIIVREDNEVPPIPTDINKEISQDIEHTLILIRDWEEPGHGKTIKKEFHSFLKNWPKTERRWRGYVSDLRVTYFSKLGEVMMTRKSEEDNNENKKEN